MKVKVAFLKPLLMGFTVMLYVSVSTAEPWVSSPSAIIKGDDVKIQGGGALGSTELLISLHDRKSGKKISEAVVFTRSNGDFSASFPAVDRNVEVRVVVNGNSITSTTTTSSSR